MQQISVEYWDIGNAEYMVIIGKVSKKIVVVINNNLQKAEQDKHLQDIFRMLGLKQD